MLGTDSKKLVTKIRVKGLPETALTQDGSHVAKQGCNCDTVSCLAIGQILRQIIRHPLAGDDSIVSIQENDHAVLGMKIYASRTISPWLLLWVKVLEDSAKILPLSPPPHEEPSR